MPHGPLDEAEISELPTGKVLRARITHPRNVDRLRYYFALLDVVRDNMESPPPRQTLHDAIKVRLGYTTPVRFKNGQTVEVPRSVAFEAMEEAEFASFLESFKALVRSNPAMERAAREMLGD